MFQLLWAMNAMCTLKYDDRALRAQYFLDISTWQVSFHLKRKVRHKDAERDHLHRQVCA